MEKLLNKKSELRLTAEEALNHDFFNMNDFFQLERKKTDSFKTDRNVLTHLSEFKGSSHLKKAALNMLARNIEPS